MSRKEAFRVAANALLDLAGDLDADRLADLLAAVSAAGRLALAVPEPVAVAVVGSPADYSETIPTTVQIAVTPKPPRVISAPGEMPAFIRRIVDALVEFDGDRKAAAAKLGIKQTSLTGTVGKITKRTDLTDRERAVLAGGRTRKVNVLPDGAPAPLPPVEESSAETPDERRLRVARERNAQTWRELHPDAASA